MNSFTKSFNEALIINRKEEESYVPLLEKFKELKDTLEENFKVQVKTEKKLFRKPVYGIKPKLEIELAEKLLINNQPYLFIRINNRSYLMSIGEIGDLKGKVYFLYSTPGNNKDMQSMYKYFYGFYEYEYNFYENNLLTLVQLFSYLIKEYKRYLVIK